MHSFHSLKAAFSTYFRLHNRLPNSFKAVATSSLHFLKSILDGNMYIGPLENYISDSRIRSYQAALLTIDRLRPRDLHVVSAESSL